MWGRGNCLKYLKRGWKGKKGRGNKYFKKGGQAGPRGGCLEKGGAGTPLRTMIYVSLMLSSRTNLVSGGNNIFHLKARSYKYIKKTVCIKNADANRGLGMWHNIRWFFKKLL